jgi:sn-glycerol 3-phosphate transport system substrate-binding protein
MKKICFAAVLLILGGFVVCAGGKEQQSSAGEAKAHLVFWHGLGGSNGETINMLVDQFNQSQSRITVEAQFQGSYEDSINKLRTSMRTKSGPDIVQIYEGGTRFMIDSGFIIPMQNLIDAYNIDISKLEKNILAYYTINGRLNSIPFNTSVPLLYYNKTLLTRLGYPNGPADWKELKEIALKVVNMKDPNIPYGFAQWSDPWLLEQPLNQARVPIVDNDNGRSSAPTKCILDQNDLALRVLRAWKDLKDSGAMADLGFSAGDTNAAFTAGMAAMTTGSTSNVRNFLSTIGDKFELGTAFFPPLDKNEPNGGVTLGGASLYVLDNGRGKTMETALVELIKFMISPETQAFWHARSGYYPITTEAYNFDSVQENLRKYPQFQTAIDQLHFSTNMGFGAIYGSFVEGRATYKQYIEQMLMGQISPEEALKKSVEGVNTLISNYNRANR